MIKQVMARLQHKETSAITKQEKLAVNNLVERLRLRGLKFDKSFVHEFGGHIVVLALRDSSAKSGKMASKIIQDILKTENVQFEVEINRTLQDEKRYVSLTIEHPNRGTKYSFSFITIDELYGMLYLQF
jgi:hypothetical protein